MNTPLRSRLLLLAAAALFSTGGAAIKATSLNSWQVASFRSGIAAVALLIVVPEARRNWRLRYVPIAAAYAATLLLFVGATKLTTAANAIYLQAAAPFFVILLGPLLLREKIRRSDLLLMAAVAGGMLLFFTAREPAVATAPNPGRGNVLGALSALTWALTIVGLRWLERGRRTSAGLATVAMGNGIAFVAALPGALPVPAWHARDAAVMLWLGVFQIALAYVCITRGIRHVPVFEATVLLMLEPALNPVWTWLVHGERPAAQSLGGGAIILSATLANALWQNRSSRAA